MKLYKYILVLVVFNTYAQSEKLTANIQSGQRGTCIGAGMLCNISTDNGAESKGNLVSHTLQGVNDKTIALEIDTDEMGEQKSQAMITHRVSSKSQDPASYLVIPDAIILEKELLQQLNINPSYNIIEVGEYLIRKEKNLWRIEIELKKIDESSKNVEP